MIWMANVEVHRPFENGESSTIINPNNQESIIILPYAQSIKVVSSGYISTNIHYFPVYMFHSKPSKPKQQKLQVKFASMPRCHLSEFLPGQMSCATLIHLQTPKTRSNWGKFSRKPTNATCSRDPHVTNIGYM